jgi:predicted extracellular nuclease
MRVRIVPGSVVLNGRNVFPSTLDGEVWLAHPDTEIAGRSGYERRSFRDPHPLDNDPALFDDGNGYRIVLGSLGIKAAAGDNTALIAPSRTFDTVDNEPVGGVYFSFSKYQIQVEQQLELTPGADPDDNAPPSSFDRSLGYSVATLNVENLYDYRDDPFDGCDFTGNGGCPGVNPPFDYVPASNAAYQARLQDIAGQIVDDLHAPDLILVQEAEDQDLCTFEGPFACGSSNDADGKPDTLQELASVIAAQGGPAYDAAYDRDGADDRGIVSGFLFRTDRAELLPAAPDDPVLGSAPTVDYRGAALAYNTDVQNPKVLNADLPGDVDLSTGSDGTNVFTRPAQVGLFRLWRDGVGSSVFIDVYALSNHFSSTPNARVGQRTEQAAYAAAIVAALQGDNPTVPVVVGGDLNVYPRPDDPFTPGHPLYPSDQLGPLYDAGLINLYDSLVSQAPSSAYSYVFEGQAQTLDQIFLTPSLEAEFDHMDAAHINSDWPAEHDGDGARGTSDHDPQVAVFSLAPSLDRLEALLNAFIAAGDITGNNTAVILQDRLDRASQFKEAGQTSAYLAQLQAFANQVLGFTPKFITAEAGAALADEADLLRSLGG